MAHSGKILAGAHLALRDKIYVGMDTWEIEEIVNQYIIDHDAKPSETI